MTYYILLFLLSLQVIAYPQGNKDYSDDDDDNSFEDDILGFLDQKYYFDSNEHVVAGQNSENHQPVEIPNPNNYDYKYIPLINGKPIYIPDISQEESYSQNLKPSHYDNYDALKNEKTHDNSHGQVANTDPYENINFHGKDPITHSNTDGKYYEHVPSFYDEYKSPIIEVKPNMENADSYVNVYQKADINEQVKAEWPITHENIDNSADVETPKVVEVLVKKEMPVTHEYIDTVDDAELPAVVEAVVKKEISASHEEIPDEDDDSEPPNVVEVLVKKEMSVEEEDDEMPIVVESLTETKPVVQVVPRPLKPTSKPVVKSTLRPLKPTSKPVVEVTPRPLKPTSKPVVKVTPRPEKSFYEFVMNEENTHAEDHGKELLNEITVNNDDISLESDEINDDVDLLHTGDENKLVPFEDGSGLELNEGANTIDGRSFLPADPNIWSLMSNVETKERQKYSKCFTPKNETGNCMPIQMCSVPNIASSIEELVKNVCTLDEVFIGVCCPEFPVETVRVDWGQFQEQPQSEAFNDKKTSQVVKECGKLPTSTGEATPSPWMAPLAAVATDKIFCGGVLISEQYVLTAAHCTTKIPRNQILVRLGPLDSQSKSEDLAVVEIKRHAKYNRRTMQNDIALLKLSRRVQLGDLRSFVCLPNEDDGDYVGETAILLGRNATSGKKAANESLPVISKRECQNKLGLLIDDSVLCTLPRTEEATCNDDSGAPLVIGHENRFKVVGLLTWNRNDCDGRFPSLYTRISSYRGWIQNHII